ncbi:MAG: glyoxalase [Actinomycetota bacterium]|nr:glyoxalase [Actinomycetota bacterium]
MEVSLDHVQIAAPPGCEADARRFFGELLGLNEVQKPKALQKRGGVWFQVGTQQLHIGVEEPFRAAQKAHPAFRVADGDIDSLARRLSDSGETVQWDGSLPGVRRLYTADPWGNRIEVLARP